MACLATMLTVSLQISEARQRRWQRRGREVRDTRSHDLDDDAERLQVHEEHSGAHRQRRRIRRGHGRRIEPAIFAHLQRTTGSLSGSAPQLTTATAAAAELTAAHRFGSTGSSPRTQECRQGCGTWRGALTSTRVANSCVSRPRNISCYLQHCLSVSEREGAT